MAEPPAREVPSIGREQTEAAKGSGSGYDWAHQWYPVRAFALSLQLWFFLAEHSRVSK